MRIFIISIISLSILSCSGSTRLIDEQIKIVNSFAPNIELGIKRSDFVALANSAGIKFEGELFKKPESFINNGKTYNIYFLRTE